MSVPPFCDIWRPVGAGNLYLYYSMNALFCNGNQCDPAGKDPLCLRINGHTNRARLMSRPVCGAADRDRTGTVFPQRDFKSLASACFATAACHDTKLVYHGVAEYVKVPFFHRGCGRDTWRRLRRAGARWKARRQIGLMEKGRPARDFLALLDAGGSEAWLCF